MLGFNVSTTNTDLEKQAAEDYLPLGILEELANRSLDVVGDGIHRKSKQGSNMEFNPMTIITNNIIIKQWKRAKGDPGDLLGTRAFCFPYEKESLANTSLN